MPGDTSPNKRRDDEIYIERMRGVPVRLLAEKHGLSVPRIYEITHEVSRSLPERDRSELLAVSVAHLEDLREKVRELAEMEGAPVFVGKDGAMAYDEDGSVVRDYSLRRSAYGLEHDINKTFAKRLGLDAPAQTEVKASVQYEIVGVDVEDLT
jgi:hypothetical protein